MVRNRYAATFRGCIEGRKARVTKNEREEMPIRQRGSSWQVDVRTIDGTRIRASYATEEEAREAETALNPNPTARAEARKIRARALARSNTSRRTSAGSSPKVVAICDPPTSGQAISPEPASHGQASAPGADATATPNSAEHCAQSAPQCAASSPFQRPPLRGHPKEPSPISNTKPPSEQQAHLCNSPCFWPETQHSEGEQSSKSAQPDATSEGDC